MSFINQCKKYMTFIKLKYASSTNYNEMDAEAATLCLAIIDNNYEDEDISLAAITNKAKAKSIWEPDNSTGRSSFFRYLKMLEDSYHGYKRKSVHEKLIEMIKLNINTLYKTSFQKRTCRLTKDNIIITSNDGINVEFEIMYDGLIRLIKTTKADSEAERNYLFKNLEEFAAFTNNLEENIEIDDSVIKMVFI